MSSLRLALRRALNVRLGVYSKSSVRSFALSPPLGLKSSLVIKNVTKDLDLNQAGSTSEVKNTDITDQTTPVKRDPTDITLAEFLKDERFHKNVRIGVRKLGFSEFTPVQQRALIPFLNENGVVCKAKTGTGKTYSFVIPLINRCMENMKNDHRGVTGLIIAPTRDLARQIYEDIVKLSLCNSELNSKISAALWCGGMQRTVQSSRRHKPQIIVGTPGRVLDNLQGAWGREFKQLEYRVFDEADRLLDQGFERELVAIDDVLQGIRDPSHEPLKNTLFSATVDQRVTDFARSQIGEDFKYINCVSENETMSHKAIEQELIQTQSLHDSVSAAVHHMIKMSEEEKNYKAIFFLPTKVFAEACYNILRDLTNSRTIWRLHGDMSQAKRDRTTADFKRSKRGILVCTDVAARGMDYKNITEVVQVGLSREPADYIHKIGRTGRAGASGSAKLFLSQPELPFANILVKEMGIDFAKKTQLDPASVQLVFDKTSMHPEDAESQTMSLIGAQKSVADTYNLNRHAIVKDVIDLYRVMLGDMSARLYMSADRVNKIGLPASLVPDHIEVDDERRLKGNRNNQRGMRQQFNRNTRGSGFGSNDRYGNSGYNNRRSDRFSNYRSDNNGRNSRSLYDNLRELDGQTSGYRSKRTFR